MGNSEFSFVLRPRRKIGVDGGLDARNKHLVFLSEKSGAITPAGGEDNVTSTLMNRAQRQPPTLESTEGLGVSVDRPQPAYPPLLMLIFGAHLGVSAEERMTEGAPPIK